MKVIGFTGTRDGLTDAQRAGLRLLLVEESGAEPCEYQHGQCVGADAAFDEEACGLALPGSVVVARPSNVRALTAELSDPPKGVLRVYHDPLPPLVRNRLIVRACDVLLACPAGPELARSGTWSTVRFCRKLKKPVRLVMPDGLIVNERLPVRPD